MALALEQPATSFATTQPWRAPMIPEPEPQPRPESSPLEVPEVLLSQAAEPVVVHLPGDELLGRGIGAGDHLILDAARRDPAVGEIVAALNVAGIYGGIAREEDHAPTGWHLLRAAVPGEPIIASIDPLCWDEYLIGCYAALMPTGARGGQAAIRREERARTFDWSGWDWRAQRAE